MTTYVIWYYAAGSTREGCTEYSADEVKKDFGDLDSLISMYADHGSIVTSIDFIHRRG